MSRGVYLPQEAYQLHRDINEEAATSVVVDTDDLYGRHSLQVIHEAAAGEREMAVYMRPKRSYFIRVSAAGIEGIWPR
ncbi:hypothetical protein J4U02_gp136 [Mycobacterium phage Aziz]|uniref:Uncharacterized protein n=1 Tax=Mycobacterium phage Aziz TaxID=2762281 RepID=A0A7G8LHQ4_9CAUD|nr:hypothetical protein J4U02_gp136 [Mycobacterium phage Aziz]ASR75963.1 hypothetical protein SEA_GENEVAB15_141 [Mycobacterium phage GenevaB15]QNJ56776.1 hypothetical protein SEA_AZIZ_138 [Mycobacterium phage Aziz]